MKTATLEETPIQLFFGGRTKICEALRKMLEFAIEKDGQTPRFVGQTSPIRVSDLAIAAYTSTSGLLGRLQSENPELTFLEAAFFYHLQNEHHVHLQNYLPITAAALEQNPAITGRLKAERRLLNIGNKANYHAWLHRKALLSLCAPGEL